MSKAKKFDPKPPRHLNKETKAWWRSIADAYDLEPHHVRLLRLACEAWDRAQEARAAIKKHGAVYRDRFGAPRKHPAVAIEETARAAFVRCVNALDLDNAEEEPGTVRTRPPRHRGRFTRRTRRVD